MFSGIGSGMRRTIVLIGAPLFIRLATLLELRRSPFFAELFIDARTYNDMAVQIANGTFMRGTPFWQPPLYPYFLAVVYKVFSPQPLVVQIIQALLGAVSCLLIHRIGARFFGKRAAWIAWAAAALCGPLVFFDLQVLSASLALFLMLLGLEFLTWGGWGRGGVSGLCLGLATITVATIAVAVPACAVWLGLRRRSVRGALPFLIGAAIPVLVVFASNLAVSGEPVAISYNGGVNFWIGNNPDYDATVALRPGRAWTALMAEPVKADMASPSASSAYFFQKSFRWIRAHPEEWLSLMLRKTLLFLRAYEIPRDQEIYPFRSSSIVMRLLLWIHGIGFPFGVILPLGVVGIVTVLRECGRKRERFGSAREAERLARIDAISLAVIPALLALAVIVFFVTARYRLPVLPFLILFAAAGIDAWIPIVRERRWREAALPAALVVGLGLVANTGLPAMPTMFNSDAYSDLGTSYLLKGDREEARRLYETALTLSPRNAEAMHNLGVIAMDQDRLDDAERYFRQVLEVYPDDPNAMNNLGNVALRRGDLWTAGQLYYQVLKVDPNHANTRESLQNVEMSVELLKRTDLRRDPEKVLGEMEARLRREPGNDFLYLHLIGILEDQGLYDRALAVVRERLAHSPSDANARQTEARLEGIVSGTRPRR